MVRRGWLTILVITLLGVAAAFLYLAVTPKTYGASTTLFVATAAPDSINDLQQGANFAGTAVVTYAQIIDSGTVLTPVAAELRPQRSVDELVGRVTATVREQTTLIDIEATTNDPRSAAVIANAVADESTRILPALQLNPIGRPLVRVQQIRPAVEPLAPSAPNRPRILLIGLVVGLFAGLAATIVRQSMDTRVRRSDDILGVTNVPVIAALPTMDKAQRAGLVARDDPTSAAGEAFRTLRTNLGTATAREVRSLVFTAASGTHDGALVPANLAWSLAQSGRKTLLIDADMRASAVGDLFGIDRGAGLAEVLAEPESTGIAHGTRSSLLRVMLSGTASIRAVGPAQYLGTRPHAPQVRAGVRGGRPAPPPSAGLHRRRGGSRCRRRNLRYGERRTYEDR